MGDLVSVTHVLEKSMIVYCNMHYAWLTLKMIQRPQVVQNEVARILMGTCYGVHISPVSYQLHRLPIRFLLWFRLLVLTFKAFTNCWLGIWETGREPADSWRSADAGHLQMPVVGKMPLEGMWEKALTWLIWNTVKIIWFLLEVAKFNVLFCVVKRFEESSVPLIRLAVWICAVETFHGTKGLNILFLVFWQPWLHRLVQPSRGFFTIAVFRKRAIKKKSVIDLDCVKYYAVIWTFTRHICSRYAIGISPFPVLPL